MLEDGVVTDLKVGLVEVVVHRSIGWCSTGDFMKKVLFATWALRDRQIVVIK